jgi:outer membrane protein OmpA-like peptidoglycan-associated protein
VRSRSFVVVIVAVAAVASGVTANTSIPLCPGLTIVTAVSQPEGDYESIKTIDAVTSSDVTLRYSAERKLDGALQKIKIHRTTPAADLKTATLYVHIFDSRAAVRIPAATAMGTSSSVLRALKTKGAAELALVDAVGAAAPVNRNSHPNIYDYQMVETIRRVGTGTVPISVTVNGIKIALPTIQARGDYYGDKAEFFFLDDDANPMALKYRIGRDVLDVVKVSYACSVAPGSTQTTEASALERALAETGRTDVYSLYFSFNSDELREESEPTLKLIAELLRRRSDWRLGIGGHTDSVAGDAYNLDLSRRRAAAVKDALVKRYLIDAGRLTTTGHGEASPKDTNDTLEGRARNRRVELVRVPSGE